MYLVQLKSAIVEALASAFVNHPNTDFRGANKPNIGIEYPIEKQHYPGVWVQYEDTDELTTAGIGHVEYVVDTTNHTYGELTRWKFTGSVTLTIFALSSLERDRLYDEVVRTFAFGEYNQSLSTFRDKIETNDLIAMNVNFDSIRPFGDTAGQGTPWQTDEMLYEKSLSFDVIGEFVGDASMRALVPLSKVTYMDYVDGTTPPKFVAEPGSTTVPPTPGNWDRTKWT